MKPLDRTKARCERWSSIDARNDDVKRLIQAGDTEANIRRRYPMSDTIFSKLQMQCRVRAMEGKPIPKPKVKAQYTTKQLYGLKKALPEQLRRARGRVAMLERQAAELGMTELL